LRPAADTAFARRAVASSQLRFRLALDNLADELVLEHGSGFYRAGFGATGSLELTTDL
jgi:hypothetical protein